VIEVRWHARAGQGAKSAAVMLATALLEAGQSVQAFPEYGPERRGAPMRAYTRVDGRSIRRHDTVTEPDVVVVLEPSLLAGGRVTDGLRPGGLLLVNTDRPAQEVRDETGWQGELICVPGTYLAAERGLRFANVVLLGALAAALGQPSLEGLLDSVGRLLGKKGEEAAAAARAAVTDGYLCVAGELACAS
jgi:pyruvate ferredoxin oxidoreductase gamma subunit